MPEFDDKDVGNSESWALHVMILATSLKNYVTGLVHGEIIEPGQVRRDPPVIGFGRFTLLVQSAKIVLMVSLPAVLLDWISYELWATGFQADGLWAWFALVFFAPPALFFSMVAALTLVFFMLVCVLTLTGRAVGTRHSMFFTNNMSVASFMRGRR